VIVCFVDLFIIQTIEDLDLHRHMEGPGGSIKRLNSSEIFYDRIRKMCSFNTDDCLIEVAT
jgi:hypothetical protein